MINVLLLPLLLLLLLSAGHFWQITDAQFFSFKQRATGPSSVCIGSDAIFTCIVQFYFDGRNTIVNARWMRNGTKITNCSPGTNITNCTPRHTLIPTQHGVVTGLMVDNTTMDDDGTVYTCTPDDKDNKNLTSNVILNITAEIPAVDDLNVVDKCDNVVATWKRIVGPCKNSSYNVTLLSSNGSTIDYKITNEASYTFNDTTELSSAISVSVTTVNKGYNGTARVATANNDHLKIQNISDKVCATNFNISWAPPNMTCGSVSYNITILQVPSLDEKQEVVNVTFHHFTELKSTSTYRITVVATDRRLTGPKMNHTVQLPLSEFPPMVQNVAIEDVRNQDKITDYIISWKEPTVMNLCTTALITSYDVQLDFDYNGLRYSICTTNVSTDITNISMSQYFPNHPMPNANYKATIFAVNERGRGPSSIQETEQDDDDHLNAGAVAGISIGASLVGGACGAGGVHLCHKIKSKKKSHPAEVKSVDEKKLMKDI